MAHQNANEEQKGLDTCLPRCRNRCQSLASVLLTLSLSLVLASSLTSGYFIFSFLKLVLMSNDVKY